MNFLQMKVSAVLFGVLLVASPAVTYASKAPSQAGKILLDVERKGEAWYVDPVSGERVFLANGAVAHEVLRDYGLGISNADLEKIPVGFIPVLQNPDDIFDQLEPMFSRCEPSMRESVLTQSLATFKAAMDASSQDIAATDTLTTVETNEPTWTGADAICLSGTIRELVVSDNHIPFIRAAMQSLGTVFLDSDKDRIGHTDERQFGTSPWESDTDADGHADGVEIEGGFSPLGAGNMKVDQALVNRVKGRILLQVEGVGQAWYVHPVTGRRYYLATGADAYRLMSQLGVGAPSNVIDSIAPQAESNALYQSVSKGGEACEGVACFESGIAADAQTRSMITYELPDVTAITATTEGVRILAQYIPGTKKDYASFELIQINGGAMKGGEIVDLMASNEMLPEGMTTEEKAQLAKDMEITYAHLLADIVDIMPRLTCVIKDRSEFLTQWQLVNAALEERLARNITDEPAWAATVSSLDDSSVDLANGSTSCSWQGGAL